MNSSTNATKRWWYIMPIVFITYSLAYLDRANFSFASAAGITETWASPRGSPPCWGPCSSSATSSSRSPALSMRSAAAFATDLYLPDPLGRCASLTGVVHYIPALAAIRFILGVVEAAVMPAMLIYISNLVQPIRALSRPTPS